MDIKQAADDRTEKTVRILKAMGDQNRFQIIRLLLENDLCVGALSRVIGVSKPAISQHLKILREAGLVKGEKIGYWTHYRVERDLLGESARYLRELCEVHYENGDKDALICLRTTGSKLNIEGRALEMCKNCCEQPDKLKIKPEKCTPEQIKECHGDEKEHACECEEK